MNLPFILVLCLMHHQKRTDEVSAAIVMFNDRLQAVQESCAQCVLEIARLHFPTGSLACIVESGISSKFNLNTAKSTYRLTVEKLLDELRWTVMFKEAISYKREFTAIDRVNNYIIFMRTINDMRMILRSLRKSSSWNPHARFFVLIDADVGKEWHQLVVRFFRSFWRFFVINITIMVPDTVNWNNRVKTGDYFGWNIL